MSSSKGSSALNKLFNSIGTGHFTADVLLNDEFIGNHSGWITLNDANSKGKIEMENMNNERYHSGFDANYQTISYDDDKKEMRINGYGIKGDMNGSYELTLQNIEAY